MKKTVFVGWDSGQKAHVLTHTVTSERILVQGAHTVESDAYADGDMIFTALYQGQGDDVEKLLIADSIFKSKVFQGTDGKCQVHTIGKDDEIEIVDFQISRKEFDEHDVHIKMGIPDTERKLRVFEYSRDLWYGQRFMWSIAQLYEPLKMQSYLEGSWTWVSKRAKGWYASAQTAFPNDHHCIMGGLAGDAISTVGPIAGQRPDTPCMCC